MTEKQLLCAPFRTVETIVRGCYPEPLSTSEAAQIDAITSEGQERFLLALPDATPTPDYYYSAVFYTLHNELLTQYRRFAEVVTGEVLARMQGKLPFLPVSASNIELGYLLEEFLLYHEYLINHEKPGVSKPIWSEYVDRYISSAFTITLVNVANRNTSDVEEDLQQAIQWVGDMIVRLRHSFLDIYRSALIESKNADKIQDVRLAITDILDRLDFAPLSSFLLTWAEGVPVEKVTQEGNRVLRMLDSAEMRVKQGTAKTPPVTNDEQAELSINADAIPETYNVLKPYFSQDQQASLLLRLQGANDGNNKLLFKENGNKLAYGFRQLYEANLIVGCSRLDLESWISHNFMYVAGKTKREQEYTAEYLNKIISSNAGCQSPIMAVKKVDGRYKVEAIERNKKKVDNF